MGGEGDQGARAWIGRRPLDQVGDEDDEGGRVWSRDCTCVAAGVVQLEFCHCTVPRHIHNVT